MHRRIRVAIVNFAVVFFSAQVLSGGKINELENTQSTLGTTEVDVGKEVSSDNENVNLSSRRIEPLQYMTTDHSYITTPDHSYVTTPSTTKQLNETSANLFNDTIPTTTKQLNETTTDLFYATTPTTKQLNATTTDLFYGTNPTRKSTTVTEKAIETTTKYPGPQWSDIEKNVKNLISTALKQLLPNMIRTTSSANLSGSCYSNMLKMLLGVRSLKAWAFRMLDASAKFGSGILDGVTTDFGAYEQCLNIIVLNKRSKKEDFRGKYCTMKINPNFPAPSAPLDPRLHDTVFGEIKEALTFLSSLNYFVGLCIPSTCSTEDAEKLAKAALQDIVQVAVPHCEIKTETKLNAEQIGVLSIHGTLILLVIIGTTLDLWKQYQPKKNTNESKTSKPWKGRLTDFRDAGKNISFLVVWNSWLQVDTFFFITGVTLTYTTLRKLERTNGRLDLVRYVVHRYWRLTPPLMLVISFMFLLPLISSGPFWTKFVEPQIQNCRDTWWANMFYFTNFIGSEKQCITPYWYLAADMQLYLISPIVLVSFYR
ncbi:nose resistant to fluoxetine protein 6-like [Tachypleus tridentatus]|uniref:nose resistant to fluoxetine protein 6-like n=1 Tax=Tachypleus tridentatus TaxID=6853 RepID=UPI003FD1C797